MAPLEDLQSEDPSKIYCIGDNKFILKFEIGHMNWMRISINNDDKTKTAFDGTLRYSACCFIPPLPDEKIVMTGGCFTINGFPSNHTAEFTIKTIRKPLKKRPMLLHRYGHMLVYLNSMVYAIGGFAHKDLPNVKPTTLSACERMNVHAEKKWNYITGMNEARAFGSFITFNQSYIYVFGGMQDYVVLDTIEKYDVINDAWTTVYFKLPKPLAKLGAVLINDEAIFIAGGMSKDYEPSAECFELSLDSLEWQQKQSMLDPRLPSSGLIISGDDSNKFVYAVGGNKTQKCERYIVEEERWQLIPSFQAKVLEDDNAEENFLFTYCFCCSH